jgi:hypothetical protein
MCRDFLKYYLKFKGIQIDAYKYSFISMHCRNMMERCRIQITVGSMVWMAPMGDLSQED